MIKKFLKEVIWEYFPVFMALVVIIIVGIIEYRIKNKVTGTEFREELELITPNPEIWEP